MARNGPEPLPLPRPGRWIDQARCQGRDVADFYPEAGDVRAARAAKTFCVGCPVRQPCLEYALSLPDGSDYGVWGATSKKQRAEIRRAANDRPRRSRGPRGASAPCGTPAAYQRHRQHGEPACRPCTLAANVERQRRRERQRAEAA